MSDAQLVTTSQMTHSSGVKTEETVLRLRCFKSDRLHPETTATVDESNLLLLFPR